MATSRLLPYHSLLGIGPWWSFFLGARFGRSVDRMFSIPFGFRAGLTMREVGKSDSRLSQDSFFFSLRILGRKSLGRTVMVYQNGIVG